MSVNIIWIWPPIRSVTAGGLLRQGISRMNGPVICLNGSPAMRLDELPEPKESS